MCTSDLGSFLLKEGVTGAIHCHGPADMYPGTPVQQLARKKDYTCSWGCLMFSIDVNNSSELHRNIMDMEQECLIRKPLMRWPIRGSKRATESIHLSVWGTHRSKLELQNPPMSSMRSRGAKMYVRA